MRLVINTSEREEKSIKFRYNLCGSFEEDMPGLLRFLHEMMPFSFSRFSKSKRFLEPASFEEMIPALAIKESDSVVLP